MADLDVARSFNPLDSSALPPESVYDFQRSVVLNILQSYHGKVDSLVEAIQNSVDALERRWGNWEPDVGETADTQELPTLVIELKADISNVVEVYDNGTGMSDSELRAALIPHFSYKTNEGLRGHKGVGTAYLAYGHNTFAIHSRKDGDDKAQAYELRGSLAWAKSDEPAPPPTFQAIDVDARLDDRPGTVVHMEFGEGTNYGSLAATLHNTLAMWKFVLSTYTALGRVAFGQAQADPPHWVAHAVIEVRLSTAGSGTSSERIPIGFRFPLADVQKDKVAELQALQNKPGNDRRYELVYLSRSHDSLLALLEPDLEELKKSDEAKHERVLATLKRYEVEAFSSLAYKNTYYQEWSARQIGNPDAQRFTIASQIRGGLLIASAGMPIGETVEHIEDDGVFKPEQRRRLFTLLQFNALYRPDIGRKTIPRELIETISFLERSLRVILDRQAHRLIRTAEDSTHQTAGYAQAQQQLKNAALSLGESYQKAAGLELPNLVLSRAPRSEAELAAIFASLYTMGYCPGMTVKAIPGSTTRYDMLFDVSLTTQENSQSVVAAMSRDLSIHPGHFVADAFQLTDQWGEFKLNAEDVLQEFDAADGAESKKYFSQVDLLVAWRVPEGDVEKYQFTALQPEERTVPGATHALRVDGNDHVVQVISVMALVALALELDDETHDS